MCQRGVVTDPPSDPTTDHPSDPPAGPPSSSRLGLRDLVIGSTRLGIGALLLAGDAAAKTVAKVGVPTERALPVPSARPSGIADLCVTITVAAVLETERRVLDVAENAGRRTVLLVAALTPHRFVDPLLARWYARGVGERLVSTGFAGAVITEVFQDTVDVARVRIEDTIDLTALTARLDPNPLATQIDLNPIVDRLDIDRVVDRIDLNEIIMSSTTGIAGEALDVARSQGIAFDSFASRVVNAILRRRATPPATPDPTEADAG